MLYKLCTLIQLQLHMASGVCMLLWCQFLLILSYFCLFCLASNILRPGEILKDGDNITSSRGKFVLGFFSPADSTQRFLGIWYADLPEQSVVWVANRNKPGSEQNGMFTMEKDGNLVVKDHENGDSLWSSNSSVAITNSTAVVLLDTGNLAITGNNNKVLWESFQNPTDTFLPQMRILMDLHSGERRIFSSWTSKNDPSPGRYSFGFDPHGSMQIVIWDGPIRRWRSGYWNGLVFTGIPDMKSSFIYGFRLFPEEDKLYFTYTTADVSDLVRYQIIWTGYELQQKWDEHDGQWKPIQYLPSGGCDPYNLCGNFARCSVSNSPKCLCLERFVPNDLEEWKAGNWTGGCVREIELECKTNRDAFMAIERIKLPDFADTNRDGLNIDECKRKCLENCSCTAYAFVTAIDCMTWSGELVDLQQFKEGGNTLYVRVAHSESGKKSGTFKIVLISALVAGAFVVISITVWILCKYKTKRQPSKRIDEMPIVDPIWRVTLSMDLSGSGNLGVEGHKLSGSELTFFSFSRVSAATDNFSNANKLGQAGFGPVFKGKLQSGEEIAVKRLSRKSGQGVEEFKNEIKLIAKLQHRNLVRLLGCCIDGEEKMLLYEYMPNKSLDSFLFDPVKQAQLNWRKRFNIIAGIARGLLYLHRDSRIRIIHRDLKASNILLDEEMNPKISDFGMARIFGGNQNEANTDRVVGTYGYMAPEYAMEGLFSGKSDVYSFGVLLLEIICGRRNTDFCTADNSGIIDYAWEKWDDGMAMDLVDHSIWDECQHDEALRCIHIALLCLQDLAVHRPDMSSVVLMLETENIRLDSPRQPTFTSLKRSEDATFWNQNQDLSSDKVAVSVTVGR